MHMQYISRRQNIMPACNKDSPTGYKKKIRYVNAIKDIVQNDVHEAIKQKQASSLNYQSHAGSA